MSWICHNIVLTPSWWLADMLHSHVPKETWIIVTIWLRSDDPEMKTLHVVSLLYFMGQLPCWRVKHALFIHSPCLYNWEKWQKKHFIISQGKNHRKDFFILLWVTSFYWFWMLNGPRLSLNHPRSSQTFILVAHVTNTEGRYYLSFYLISSSAKLQCAILSVLLDKMSKSQTHSAVFICAKYHLVKKHRSIIFPTGII